VPDYLPCLPWAAEALTPRVQRLRDAAHAAMTDAGGRRTARFVADLDEYLSKEELRVASYRKTAGQPTVLRRARAFAHICRHWPIALREDELILGSQRGNIPWGFAPSPEQQARLAALEQEATALAIAHGEGHVVCDYPRPLTHGLRREAERIRELLDGAAPDDPRRDQWQAMLITCEAARDFARRHAEGAREAASSAPPERAEELRRLAGICERVPWEPATNLAEAVQSFWFLHLLLHVESPSVAVSPGRLDQTLGPYFAAEPDHAHAAELLACLWLKFWGGEESQNLVVGGTGPDGTDASSDLSVLMADLTGLLHAFQPSLSVRLHPSTAPGLLRAAAHLAAAGTGQPSFFSDDVVRPALHSIGIPAAESWDYAIVGCYEAVVAGAEWGRTVACGVALPEVVLAALATRPATAEALLTRTREGLAAAVEDAVRQANAAEDAEREGAPSPFQSVLMRDCVERGADIYAGGARHNHTACWLSGLAAGVDSLWAVMELVYRRGALSLADLLSALDADFAGHEALRLQLLQQAKFGNDAPPVDALAGDLCEAFCANVVAQRNPRGGCFQPSLAMYQQHYRGLSVGATPDGRHTGEPFAAGVAASPGANTSGVTALLASCARLPHHLAPNGNFLMISLLPDQVAGAPGEERLAQLIETYFAEGGSHIMLNAVSPATLRDARAHPERHRDLMVRISGLSTYFVTLPEHIQQDIIARTAQGL
jgi:pyruvate-formate lyase